MPIILSVIVTSQPQANGTLLVHEQHTDHTGMIYDHIYNAQIDSNIELVAQLRGEQIGIEIDKLEAAKLESLNYEMPLTDLEIMRRLTPAEWASFLSSTDETIAYFRSIFLKVKVIYRNDPLTIAGFEALVTNGILTQARVIEVLA
jgi:hypothetical protein